VKMRKGYEETKLQEQCKGYAKILKEARGRRGGGNM